MEKENKPTKLVICLLFFFFLFFYFTRMITMAQNTTDTVNVNVGAGVVLNLETLDGKTWLSCINVTLSDFYAANGHYKTRLLLNYRDSKSDVVGAAAAAIDLIKNVEVQAIIGPDSSMHAKFVIDLGQKAQVPIVTFSATSPSLASVQSEYFIRAAQNDSSQVMAVSTIVKAFGWREIVLMYVDNEYGEGIVPYMTDALEEVDTRVSYRSVIPPSATDDQIVEELYKLMTMQTRVFIVHMLPSLASRLFTKARNIGMMNTGFVWILADGIANAFSSLDSVAIDSMQGVLGVKAHVPKSKEVDDFRVRWKRKFHQDNPSIVGAELDIFGLWAHDAVVALAMAVETAGTTDLTYQKQNGSGIMVSDLETLGVSQNGPKLLQALLSTEFRGLSGNFSLVGGQLQSSAFQIVNINGNGLTGIGFWTPQSGLVKKLSMSNTISSYSTSKADLGTIIWPGDSTSVPKGWEIPTNEKKLRVGVPKKYNQYSEFVKVTRDPITNITNVSGYSIDVFKAVMDALPYVVPYELIPYEPNGEDTPSYDELIYQVFLQKFDAVVGDVTIVANRSQYVDFTLPYMQSGVAMTVPIKDNKRKNAWAFLKPLTWDLWLTIACFFVFIGFIVWILEHRINPDFRGPPLHQLGTSFCFSFSTMVFAHKETVVSNLARSVMVIWFFVVLILTQSYTASLASLLTVEQLQPTVTDVRELVKNGDYVGYQIGSFVYGILKNLGFNESKLVAYISPEECDELFQKGAIAAAFNEVPYMKLFLAQHCSKYTMIEPTFKTAGFGFVFPRGSPLASDVSRAILNVTEGDKMTEIERAWLEPKTRCPDPGTSVSSNSLGLESFWGLFLIVGVSAVLALIIYAAMFLYGHRDVIIQFDPSDSIWRRIVVLFRHFDQKDLSSHTFKKNEVQDMGSVGEFPAVEASPAPNYPLSPLSNSSHMDPQTVLYGEQGTPLTELGQNSPE